MEKYIKISIIALFISIFINIPFWIFMMIFYGNCHCDEVPTICNIADIGLFIIFINLCNVCLFAGILFIKEELL